MTGALGKRKEHKLSCSKHDPSPIDCTVLGKSVSDSESFSAVYKSSWYIFLALLYSLISKPILKHYLFWGCWSRWIVTVAHRPQPHPPGVPLGSCWWTWLLRESFCSWSRSPRPSEQRWQGWGSNKSRCRSRSLSLTTSKGRWSVHYGWFFLKYFFQVWLEPSKWRFWFGIGWSRKNYNFVQVAGWTSSYYYSYYWILRWDCNIQEPWIPSLGSRRTDKHQAMLWYYSSNTEAPISVVGSRVQEQIGIPKSELAAMLEEKLRKAILKMFANKQAWSRPWLPQTRQMRLDYLHWRTGNG